MEDKKPCIRFNGFREAWKADNLSSLFSFDIPHNSLSRDKLNDNIGNVQNIHYGDILIKYGSIVDAVLDKIPYISDSSTSDYAKAELKDGDVIFADTAEDTTTGKAIELQNINTKSIVSGLHTIVARSEYEFAPCFLGYNFNSETFHSQLIPLMQGTKVLSINKSALQNTQIKYPTDTKEQQKIGEFFKELDGLILAKEQEVEKLKQIKAALLDNMFPNEESGRSNQEFEHSTMIIDMLQNNNLVYCENNRFTPRIRFRGFTSNWERKQLNDVCSTYSGGTPLTTEKDYYNGSISFIRSGEIHNSVTELTITNKGLNNSAAKMVNKGDILLAMYGATSGEIDISKINGAINQAILCIITSEDKYFFKYSWEKNVNRIIASYIQGAQGNLSAELIKDCYMMFPTDITEQRIIGSFFAEQDKTINNAQQQIVKLLNIKQACLQQMYV